MRATVGRFGRLVRFGARYQTTAGGAVVILALASGLALGFGAVAERLVTTGTSSVSSVEASASRLIPPASVEPNRWQQGATGASPRHVVDRWFDEPEATTTSLPLGEWSLFYDEEDGAACDRAPCRKIRRWLTATLAYASNEGP